MPKVWPIDEPRNTATHREAGGPARSRKPARQTASTAFEEIAMNAKSILAALSLALAGSAALAAEATEFTIPASTLTRAEVQSAIGTAPRVVNYGEATVFADAPVQSRDREEVRDEARAAAQRRTFDELQAG
jgi:hypothetical protein